MAFSRRPRTNGKKISRGLSQTRSVSASPRPGHVLSRHRPRQRTVHVAAIDRAVLPARRIRVHRKHGVFSRKRAPAIVP